MRVIVPLAAALALALAPAAQAATTPGRAARVTRACLIDRGWSARLADRGATVEARAPRLRTGYPSRPFYSVAFYRFGRRGIGASEVRMALNRRENATATACKRAGLRG